MYKPRPTAEKNARAPQLPRLSGPCLTSRISCFSETAEPVKYATDPQRKIHFASRGNSRPASSRRAALGRYKQAATKKQVPPSSMHAGTNSWAATVPFLLCWLVNDTEVTSSCFEGRSESGSNMSDGDEDSPLSQSLAEGRVSLPWLVLLKASTKSTAPASSRPPQAPIRI